jgi:hypothetical protein
VPSTPNSLARRHEILYLVNCTWDEKCRMGGTELVARNLAARRLETGRCSARDRPEMSYSTRATSSTQVG